MSERLHQDQRQPDSLMRIGGGEPAPVDQKYTNRLLQEDKPAHEWYRFVLSYPPHLVRRYVAELGVEPGDTVLDPFCGTGTTLVECKKLGINSIGLETNPMARFASQTKVRWDVSSSGLLEHARAIASKASEALRIDGSDNSGLPLFRLPAGSELRLRTLTDDQSRLILKDSISPIPLHRVLTLLDTLETNADARYCEHERLALAKTIVYGASNLHFGPEVGVSRAKPDAPVIPMWLGAVSAMANDISALQRSASAHCEVHQGDARDVSPLLASESIDAVITSPPYPNEKDYTRTTRLESVILGFMRDKGDLRAIKETLVRSNTRNVFKADTDDGYVAGVGAVQSIADEIESRRIELKKTSGFERQYSRVTRLYFGGMARHLASLRPILKPGARLAYVVGDQASYLQVMIRTGRLLADIAVSLGYELHGIDLFRTRLATATREQLREEVVVLRWPGGRSSRRGNRA